MARHAVMPGGTGGPTPSRSQINAWARRASDRFWARIAAHALSRASTPTRVLNASGRPRFGGSPRAIDAMMRSAAGTHSTAVGSAVPT
ncbi:MAG: hypothetical protein ACFCBV_05700 [Phycisphaerales bacterium]